MWTTMTTITILVRILKALKYFSLNKKVGGFINDSETNDQPVWQQEPFESIPGESFGELLDRLYRLPSPEEEDAIQDFGNLDQVHQNPDERAGIHDFGNLDQIALSPSIDDMPLWWVPVPVCIIFS